MTTLYTIDKILRAVYRDPAELLAQFPGSLQATGSPSA